MPSPGGWRRRGGGEHGRAGRALDNVFVERLWRSVKYEDVYLATRTLELGEGWGYFEFYNEERPHQSWRIGHQPQSIGVAPKA